MPVEGGVEDVLWYRQEERSTSPNPFTAVHRALLPPSSTGSASSARAPWMSMARTRAPEMRSAGMDENESESESENESKSESGCFVSWYYR